MFESLNKRSTVCNGINTQDMEFAPLKDFCGQHFVCEGFFFTDGKFGEQVVVVGAGYLINMPARACEQFHKIEQDKDMLQAVLNKHLLITDIRMIDTRNGKTTAYTLADC